MKLLPSAIVPRCLLGFALVAMPATANLVPIGPSKLGPQHVLVLYNKNQPASLAVAQAYQNARGIDNERVVALACPTSETISRAEFRDTIQEPLRRLFAEKSWWKLARTPGGPEAIEARVRVIVLAHGMPLRISRDAEAAAGKTNEAAINEASVDSELALLGVPNAPVDSAINNPYFGKKEDFSAFAAKGMFLVARVDGPDAPTARRVATEAVEVEKAGGPWGRAVIDLHRFHQLGEDWLKSVHDQCWRAGIPAQLDTHPWTLPENYPLGDCALYFGWYDWHRSGPLLDPAFRFRKGAIAVHLHSFSAQTLRHKDQNWAGPLLDRGAAATLGNVWEPYLQMTHHFDRFVEALFEGYTLAEAAYQSVPVLSWMNIVVGDPLYRPFASRGELTGERFRSDDNRSFKAALLALTRWQGDPQEAAAQLRKAGDRTRDGLLREVAGLLALRDGQPVQAKSDFEKAAALYPEKADKLRCGLLEAEVLLARGEKVFALKRLRELEKEFAAIPQAKAATAHLLKLDPPPKPPGPAQAPPPKP
jgi:uncharacterized protein (TIGR03790 family)